MGAPGAAHASRPLTIVLAGGIGQSPSGQQIMPTGTSVVMDRPILIGGDQRGVNDRGLFLSASPG